MTSLVDRIALAIARDEFPRPWWGGAQFRAMAARLMNVLEQTITTREQLEELPHLTLVTRHYTSAAGYENHEVWERRGTGWYCIAAPLNPPGHTWGTPALPVIARYIPEELT